MPAIAAAPDTCPPEADLDTARGVLKDPPLVCITSSREQTVPRSLPLTHPSARQTVHAQASSAAQFLASQAQHGQNDGRVNAPSRCVSFRSHEGRVGNRDEQTHLLHWFPAKMFYRIPIDILDAVAPPIDGRVLDPFCGSGTVLVEARARGFQTVGMDINPLSCLISQVKTTPLDGPSLHDDLQAIVRASKRFRRIPDDHILPPYWFRPAPRRTLYHLYSAIRCASIPASHRRFFTVSLTNIIRRCSLADPHIPPPVRLSEHRLDRAGTRYQRAYDHAQALDAECVYEMFRLRTIKNIELVADLLAPDLPKSIIYRRSATRMRLPQASVHTIITSPPYCGAQKYIRTFKLELSLLGYTPAQVAALDRRTLGTERVPSIRRSTTQHLSKHQVSVLEAIAAVSKQRSRMLAEYLFGLREFAKEVKRVLATDGSAFVTFGTSIFVKKHAIDFADMFSSFAATNGLVEYARLTDPIPSRGMMTKRHHTASVIPTETVLWLRHR